MNVIRMFLLSLLLGSLPCYATTLLYKSFNDLVLESDGIFLGKVKTIKSVKSQNNEIYTFVSMNNLNIIDGKYEKKQITLRLEGGFVEEEGEKVHGSPQFNVGETVLVFMEGNGKKIVPIVGWGQGLFRIKRDGKGNLVVKDSLSNSVYGISGGYIDKETQYKPNVRIVDNLTNTVFSKIPKSSEGINDTQHILVEKHKTKVKHVISRNDFISKIKGVIRVNKKKQKIIKTTHFLNTANERNANLTDAKNPKKVIKAVGTQYTGVGRVKLPKRSKSTNYQ